jgi:hypothetical protein
MKVFLVVFCGLIQTCFVDAQFGFGGLRPRLPAVGINAQVAGVGGINAQVEGLGLNGQLNGNFYKY